jgi:hypothetical protein
VGASGRSNDEQEADALDRDAFVTTMVAGIAGGAAARPDASGDDLVAYQGNGKIYVINAGGGGRRPLISSAADTPFAWSPEIGTPTRSLGVRSERVVRLPA